MRDAFPRLESSPKAEGGRQPWGEPPFASECRKALCNLPVSSDLSRSRKELYRELVMGSTPEWTARIDPKQLVLLDVGYVVDNVDPLYQDEKRVVFLAILAVARMVIWETRSIVSLQDIPRPPFFYYRSLPPVPSFWGSWTHITIIHATHSTSCHSPRFFYYISLDPLPT